MNVQALLAALVEMLQPVFDHPLAFGLAVLIVTIFGTPAKRLLSSIGALLHGPARSARTDLGPALGRAQPWTLGRLLAKLRSYAGPLFDRPARVLGRWIVRLTGFISRSGAWPVERLTNVIVRFIDPFLDETAQLLEPIAARARGASSAALAALGGAEGRWAGWRVIGGLLFFVGLAFFLFADAALSIASHEKAIGVTVGFLPDWLKEVTLAYAVASFVSALMLGLVIFDLVGMTHLGPWGDLTGPRRAVLAGIVVATAALSLTLATFLSLWRASIIVDQFIPADAARSLEGWALTLPIPLLLVGTALIGWGAIAMPWILWIAATALAWLALRVLTAALRVVALILPALMTLLGGVLRLLGIVGLIAVIAAISVALAALFIVGALGLAELLVLGVFGLALWAAAWVIGAVIVYGLQLLAMVLDGLVVLAQHVIHVLMYPGAGLWNWLASFDVARRWHLRAIPMDPSGASTHAEREDLSRPVAAA
jgi:hypothetical protein